MKRVWPGEDQKEPLFGKSLPRLGFRRCYEPRVVTNRVPHGEFRIAIALQLADGQTLGPSLLHE
jgi:hypothetical protein